MRREEFLQQLKELGAKGAVSLPQGLYGYAPAYYNESECIGCRECEKNCPEEAVKFEKVFDLPSLFKEDLPPDTKKGKIVHLLKELAQKEPESAVPLPDVVFGFGRVRIDEEKCTGCGNCSRSCPTGAIKCAEAVEV
jgi:ferredoxin